MAHKVVKYRLETDGTIPTWLKFGVTQNTGGMYPVADNSKSSPQDWIMIGISDNDVAIRTDSKVGEITSKDDLTTYLTSVSVVDGVQTWKQFDSDDKEVDFVPATAATAIWNDLTTLNS